MSEIRVNLLSDAAGTGPAELFKQSAAKAWGAVNQTGTQAIRASFNVSSIVDPAVGRTDFNWTTAMANSEYNVVTGGDWGGSGMGYSNHSRTDQTASKARSGTVISGTFTDVTQSTVSIHGDLA